MVDNSERIDEPGKPKPWVNPNALQFTIVALTRRDGFHVSCHRVEKLDAIALALDIGNPVGFKGIVVCVYDATGKLIWKMGTV